MTKLICGVDVASATLDARIGRDGPMLQVARSLEGVEQLAAFCRHHRVELLAMEATGGYEKLPFALLWAAGIACAIVNPRSVRRFAEAMGFLEKTDRIDSGLIAWYAQTRRIVAQPPASQAQQRLRAAVERLRQLSVLQTMQLNQRRLVEDSRVLASIDEILGLLRRQIRHFETEIAGLLRDDPLWTRLDQAFRTIKGVADRSVARLLAELPEIGTITNKAASKLVGLAPLARDSGRHKGARSIRGGRSNLRSILFLVTECVRRHNPDFAAFDRRLKEAGKPRKVIRIALARKLLVRLNAKARDVRAQFPSNA